MSFPIEQLKFDENGLIPAIVQDVNNQTVLMLGFMNHDSLLRTVSECKVCFWSRSRQKFWLKGETSGMFLQVRSIRVNCENNSLLILAEPIGPTCHTGHESCYYREAQETSGEWAEIAPVLTDPEALYGKK
ncbi:phosphoribosyl-AMP cyclohydrolase [Armatimonas sp.]|uniref:phosphoribosyl-AMP cyclohydrolase n=1 Tax=Armatimonas sp. TaxID=1872638 RepID=UPI00286BC3C6|nr:phosphoribosyl-AMP cyclohydrolase [Armatimonas sp.]